MLKEYRVSVVFDDWKANGSWIGEATVLAESTREAQTAALHKLQSDYYYLGEATDIEIALESMHATANTGNKAKVLDTNVTRG